MTPILAVEQTVTAPDKKEISEDLSLEGNEKKIGDLKERINQSRQAENEQTARQMGVALTELQERTASLISMDSACKRLLTALIKKETLEVEEAGLRKNLQAQQQTGIVQKPPYSLSFYDGILDGLEAAEQQKESAKLAVKLGCRSLESLAMRLENARKDLRKINDRLDSTDEKENDRELKWDMEKAELENELAAALVNFEKANHDNLLRQLKLAELRTDLSRLGISWVRKYLYFAKNDLDKHLEAIEDQRKELNNRIQKLVKEQKQAENTLLAAQMLLYREKSHMHLSRLPIGIYDNTKMN